MNRPDEKEDYQTVSRSRPREAASKSLGHDRVKTKSVASKSDPSLAAKVTSTLSAAPQPAILKRGHALSFTALFLFTIILYTRPAEFYPSPFTNYLALTVGLITLTLFAVTQMVLEGTPTARPPEINLVLLFVLTALLSIPLAIDPAIAWGEFSGTYIRGVLIFVVIVSVVRTEARLNALLLIAVSTALVLSTIAINDYRLGLLTIEGYRAAGHGTGLFGNTNDMALHLVTMLPISIALFFNSRMILGRVIHATCAAIMMSGILLSFSRGAFLGMLVVFVFFAFKLVRRSKLGMVLLVITAAVAIILLAPSGYGTRLLSIFIPGLDPGGSADSRRGELIRSAYVALRHPLLGVGMGNYQPLMSLKGLVTHNSYTQVAAEMGMTALVLYIIFIVAPFRKLSAITRETFGMRKDSRFYYLALGLQASLLAFMVSSFFLSVAYSWNVYYLVGYAVCFRRLYEAGTGRLVVIEKRKDRNKKKRDPISIRDVKEQPATA